MATEEKTGTEERLPEGRLVEKPYIIGALLRFSGFWWATFKKEKRTVSKDFLDYVRKEQKERFRNIFLLKKENI